MFFQTVEAGPPHPAVRLQPLVELDEWFGAKAVETPLAVRANGYKPRLTQNAQMLRHRRLAQGEPLDERLNRMLALTQFIEYLPPVWLRDDLERRGGWHRYSMPRQLYICQGI